jgi:hypothetical protein
MSDLRTIHPAALGQLRVGDADREAVAHQLSEHHAAGRLTLAELEERLTTVWSARTGNELAAPLVDLPTSTPPPMTPPDRPPPSPAVVGWRLHLVSYLVVIAGLWLIWALTGSGYPWPIWPMFGWGLGLLGQRAQLAVSGQLKIPTRG